MDENNPFLEAYKKKNIESQNDSDKGTAASGEAAAPLRFEEKSEFVKVEPDRAAPPPRRNARKIAAIVVWSAVVICAVIVLVWYLNRGVKINDLTNWALTDAQIWAADNNVKLQVDEQYDDEFDEGRIISQDPSGGTMVKKDSFIKVIVSLGHDLNVTLPLPDLMSMTKSEIDSWAAENFMTKVRITTEYSDTVELGHVISYEINDTTVVDDVKRSTPIYIIVSKGKEEPVAEPVTVPDFKQMTIQQCNEFAGENGILLEFVEAYDDYVPGGSIISQSVKANNEVNKGDTIVLTVSKGKKIIMPDFGEYSREQANSIASDLGITMTILEKYSSRKTGAFISQSIEAGSVYIAGNILELYYSLGNKVVLSSFVGQTKDAIESWAKSFNDQGASIVIKTTYTQSDSPKNTIIYQDPSNAMINVSSTVRIMVSLGKVLFTPDFVAPEGSDYDLAMTREKALAICQGIGIIPVFVEADKDGRLPGEIWYQSIAAGTEIYEGSTITLKYKPADATICMPDFTGMTQEEIVGAGYLKKLTITFVLADQYVEGHPEKICEQSIMAGTTVAYGTAVTLTISPPAPPEETTESTAAES